MKIEKSAVDEQELKVAEEAAKKDSIAYGNKYTHTFSKPLSFDGNRAVVSFTLPEDAKSAAAYVYYRSGPLEYEGSELKEAWKVKRGVVLGDRANIRIPDDARLFYILIEGRTGNLFDREPIYASSGIFTAG